jgi:uncharacterized membrane protein YraQ (UPF0718 family)
MAQEPAAVSCPGGCAGEQRALTFCITPAPGNVFASGSITGTAAPRQSGLAQSEKTTENERTETNRRTRTGRNKGGRAGTFRAFGVAITVDYEQLILDFTSIIWEAMPFIVLGVVIAGFLEELVPQRHITRFIPRNRLLAIALGGFLGLLFPMCECGIIVVMRRLLRKGVPLSVCVCYMLAGPIINVVVMLSTYMAFAKNRDYGFLTFAGQEFSVFALLMMGLRMGLGFLVAFNTSLLVDWQFRKHGNKLLSPRSIDDSATTDDNDAPSQPRSVLQRMGNIAETALHDFVDVMVFLILGAFLAAFAREVMPYTGFRQVLQQTPAVSILMMMALAILLCICSEADAFVAASFSNLCPPAAKLGFLVLGPMLDFKLYMMYTRVFRPRLIWTIILTVVVQVFLFSLATHYIWEYLAPSSAVVSGSR